ncbi:acyl-CoA thioesterase [Pseudobdellovibrio sp. HCB154]|uniref:acyl-CoA thioesterase n=1 Tax=Pseudobdellovibrio sp. HCB154 TaxID=3386277 RepID=UPI003916DEFB
MLESKSVSRSQVVMTQLVLPSHTNAIDTIFGGTIMSWIDICAAIAAQRHSGREVVTASIDRLDFVAPVRKGWVVNLKASVNFVSNSSMEVGVRVDAENPKTGEIFHTASSYLTFVALGSDGRKTKVPGLILETDVEKRRFEAAKKRRENRISQRQG